MSRTEARRLSGRAPAGALLLATGFALLLSGCGIAAHAVPSAWSKAAEAASTEPAKETWLALGARLLEEGDNEGAHRAFIRSLRIEGPSAAAFTGAGVAASRQGLLTRAIRHFEHASALDPLYAAAHNNLGAALYAQGDYVGAERAFRAAYRLGDGDSIEIAKNLALAEMAHGQGEAGPDAIANMLTAIGDGEIAVPGTGEVQHTGPGEYRLSLAPETSSL